MTTETVVLELPENIYKRLRSSAQSMHRSFEDVLFQSLEGNLPPSLEDLPVDLRDEIGLSLQQLDAQSLLKVASEPIPSEQWQQHQALLEKNQEQALTANEADLLEHLRNEADKAVLRRSYALALLKWRGFTVPAHGAVENR
ncbi:MAG: hypothetical protein KDK27_19705 [Leptospiraceae bacterium]|nr:hypothetical protein [Leptospiraceae bacterium]